MVKIDKEKCNGCGMCAALSERIFGMGEDGKAYVKKQIMNSEVQEAIKNCPMEAISE